MAGLHGASRLAASDYTTSHRPPPPVPTAPYSDFVALPVPPSPPHDRFDVQRSRASEDRRQGSFGFLRRGSSNRPRAQIDSGGHVEGDAAYQRNAFGATVTGRSVSGQAKMLRKQSKVRAQQEQERLAREAQMQAQRPPPRLPSHNPLPGIASFGATDENRLDSVASISNSYANTNSNNTTNPNAAARSNFSRPGAGAMPASGFNSSSSPAYTANGGPMPGNAFAASSSSPAVGGVGGGRSNGEYVAGNERHASMTHRGRYSYTSSTVNAVNSPRRVRRRKDPTPFNILVIGAKNSGKTSFISFLRTSLALPVHNTLGTPGSEPTLRRDTKSSFTSHYLETEIDGERVGLTLWDSQGLEKNIVDLQLRDMTTFIEAKFEDTFNEEQKVMRSPGVKDTHIHCVFLVLDPIRLDANVAATRSDNSRTAEGLDVDLDLQVMKTLQGKTTVIPVISKADTLTTAHMTYLKRAVWGSLKAAKLDPLEALDLDDEDDEEDGEEPYEDVDELPVQTSSGREDSADVIDNLVDRSDSSDISAHTASSQTTPSPVQATSTTRKATHARNISAALSTLSTTDEEPYIPFSILSPDPYDMPPYTSTPPTQPGRLFPWGLADPYNPAHCDFTKLRDSIFSEWRSELREASRVRWYEQWRTSRLKNTPSRMRVKGGVTPVAAVPREGRMSPKAGRNVGTPWSTSAALQQGFGLGQAPGEPGMSRSGKAERLMGITAPVSGAVRGGGGTFRPVPAYQ